MPISRAKLPVFISISLTMDLCFMTPLLATAQLVSDETKPEARKKASKLSPSALFGGDSQAQASKSKNLDPTPGLPFEEQSTPFLATGVPTSIKKHVADMENEFLQLWGDEVLQNQASPALLAFFKLVKVDLDDTFLFQMDCCTLARIKDFSNNPLKDIAAKFSVQDLNNEATMDKITGLLTFRKALSMEWQFKHYDDDTYFLKEFDRDILRHYRDDYMHTRLKWHAQINDTLNSYTVTSTIKRTKAKLSARKESHASKSKSSEHSDKSTIASKKSQDDPGKVAIDDLTPISMTDTAANRAFMPTPDGKVEPPSSVAFSKKQPNTSLNFMRKQHERGSSGDSSKDKVRTTLPARVTWDGSFDTFTACRNKVEGHYGQTGAGYLFDKAFQKCYLRYGVACIKEFQDDVHSTSQIKKDIHALFGALCCACNVGVGQTILLQYMDAQGGIRAWMEICEKYEADGNKELHIKKLEKVINTKYTKHYKGGLLQWVSSYENAFAELVTLEEHQWTLDSAKKRKLLQNSEDSSGLNATLAQQLTKKSTFAEVCTLLRSHALNEEDVAKLNAHRKVHMVKSDYEEVMKALIHLTTKTPDAHSNSQPISQKSEFADVNANLIKNMLMELWGTVPVDVQHWLRKERSRLYAEDKLKHGGTGSNGPPQSPRLPSSNPQLPRQYNKANQMTSEDAHATLNAFLSRESAADSGEDTDDEDPLLSTAMTTVTTSYVEITDDRAAAVMNLLTLSDGTHISISDNGADTCVLGKGWHIVATHPTCRAHVIGFDKQYAQKQNLPIVTGITVVDLPEGPILLQANESIGNLSSDHTLLSEFQMREFGVGVDSKAKRHGGTQRFQVPNSGGDDSIIPLCLTRALLHMKHREPTEEELTTLKPIPITQGDVPWKPGRYNDDSSSEFFDDVRKLDEEDDDAAVAQGVQQEMEQDDNDGDDDFEKVDFKLSLRYCEHLEDDKIYHTNHFSTMGYETYNDGIFNLEDDAWYLGEMSTHYCNNLFMEECRTLKDNDVGNSFSPDIHTTTNDTTENALSGAVPKKVDWLKLVKHFAYRPQDIVRHSLRNTTQLALFVIFRPFARPYAKSVPNASQAALK